MNADAIEIIQEANKLQQSPEQAMYSKTVHAKSNSRLIANSIIKKQAQRITILPNKAIAGCLNKQA